MRFEDLSPEDQALVNTNFGDFEKEAAAQVQLAQDMYTTGFSKLACDAADALDKQAVLEKSASQEDDSMDEESEKVAQELGAFIERGFFDGLVKEGQERHNDPWHYLVPFMEEKVAQEGAAMAVAKFRKEANIGQRLLNKAKGAVRHTKRDVKMLGRHSGTGPVDKTEALNRLGRKALIGGGAAGGAGAAAYGAGKAMGSKKEAGLKDVAGKAWGATKGGAGKAWGTTKGGAGKAGKAVKDYHKGMARDISEGGKQVARAARNKGIDGGKISERGYVMREGGKRLGKGLAKASPYALLAGGGAYGTTKAVKNRNNKGE